MRETLLDPAYALQHALAVAVGRVDHQHVDAGLHQQFDALVVVWADTDRGADAQLAVGILAGVRMFGGLDDILDGDQAA